MKINPFIFREYDIRGIVDDDLTEDVAMLIGKGFGTFVKNHNGKKVSIGGDIRNHTERLRKALMAGITSTGIDVVNLGLTPTPVQYFSLHKLNVDGGIQITGSHNPPDFNGFKLSLGKASVFGPQIQEIKEIIEKDEFAVGEGSIEEVNLLPDYIDYIASSVKIKRKVKVVTDCGNGAAGLVAPELLKKMGVDLIELYSEPDGNFPNHHPDPTVVEYIQDLIAKVKEAGAEFGVGYDGDADRIGVVDNEGNIVWGDKLMILFSRDLLQREPGSTIIYEVKCSQALQEEIEKAGGKPLMWKTGHSNLKDKMKKTGALLAGEMSGHLFFGENYFGYDDAVYASVRLIELLSRSEKSLSEMLADIPQYYATPEIRMECVSDEEKFNIAKKTADYFKENYDVIDIDGVRILFRDGWGLVRPSNTQPVIVVRFEARTPERMEEIKTLVMNKLSEFGEIK
ncbi:MAG: phosphomannomutase/phosphoglucomutase [Calditrichia bacterium]|nr:phosphomannomutase/phosphoglucomutase [Calditrichia bacterium]